jgi:RecB family endonuclease NucS
MARLPSERYVIQQIDGSVVLFEDGTEREIVRFDPDDKNATAQAQGVIHYNEEMSDEDKTFAHFWSGYFHAHASGG